MKLVGIGLMGGLSLCGLNARALLEVDATVQIKAKGDLDAPLTADGTWVEAPSQGPELAPGQSGRGLAALL